MKKIKLLTLLLFMIIGALITYKFFIEKDTPVISSDTSPSVSIYTEDVIISKIKSVNKLICLETDLKESLSLDQSWGGISIFKKVQRIDFCGKGNYVVDLNDFTKDNITIKDNTINIRIKKPTINDIFIDKEKTTYYTADNGLLRFGDIELSSSDYSAIEKEVLVKMHSTLSSSKILEKAEFYSKEKIRNLVETIYNDTNIDIQINFIESKKPE